MSLGENSLVAAYQGKGQLKSRPLGTRVVTILFAFTSTTSPTRWIPGCISSLRHALFSTEPTVRYSPKGPSIKYVTLFWTNFDLPPPVTLCHTSRDTPKVRHISRNPIF